ncbi:ABC transporter substrate-binding protein, partial [Mesoaciditoga lauensis]|uniref:ABC transporter substrate-binding protein n=1 Tax=Mesoaciditoga lauensis TaxID=1495039 RepID=UPI00055CF099
MSKRYFFLTFLVVLLAGALAFATVPNPDTIIQLTDSDIVSLDPFWPYSPPSNNIDFQIYESLVQYDASSTSRFLPMLSTNVPSVKDGTILDNGKTYIFHIRQNVKFHNGDVLTPEDVKYSLERLVIFDRSGGPSWMVTRPLTGVDSLADLAMKYAGVKKWSDMIENGSLKPEYKDAILKAFNVLDKSIEVKGNDVIIHMPKPYPSLISILAHGICGSYILDKKWAVENGAWDGKASTWWKYHNPVREKDPLYAITNGTGPYMLIRWERGVQITLHRFDGYWRTPAKIKNVIIKVVKEYTTRKLMLEHGDADIVTIPQQYIPQVKNIAGVEVVERLPILGEDCGFMTYSINTNGNPYVGSGKLDGNGIPPDFFSDVNVRKAFSYMFPYKLYIKEVW